MHEEAAINHRRCMFLHLFSVVSSRWEEPARVRAGDVHPRVDHRQVELHTEDHHKRPSLVSSVLLSVQPQNTCDVL